MCAVSFLPAQTKNPAKKAIAKNDTSQGKDSAAIAKQEPEIRKEFAVYSKIPKDKKERIKLCINLVDGETILNYCVNDSICRNPEVSKILWKQKQGDTTYVLVYVDAFSKPVDKVACEAGHETKFYFARWNTTNNKAIWKSRIVCSCMRGIENMSKEAVNEWDGTSPLAVNYYRGNSEFMTLTFDPQNYQLGLQITGDNDPKKNE